MTEDAFRAGGGGCHRPPSDARPQEAFHSLGAPAPGLLLGEGVWDCMRGILVYFLKYVIS